MSNLKKTIVIVGNGTLASFCTKYLFEKHPEVHIAHLMIDESSRKYGSGLEVVGKRFEIPFTQSDNFSSRDVYNILNDLKPDFLFSICNSQILSADTLNTCVLPINFHNSLLPAYAGSNSCSWAIYNEEENFGVSFHKISVKADAGDIIMQASFPINLQTTAGELLDECVRQGFTLFKSHIAEILNDTYTLKPQDLSQRSFYSASSAPNNGFVDFKWSIRKCDSFIRAFSYFPLNSPIGYPKAIYNDNVLNIKSIKIPKTPPTGAVPGKVCIIDNQLFVGLSDGFIELTSFYDEDKKSLNAQEIIQRFDIKNDTFFRGIANE